MGRIQSRPPVAVLQDQPSVGRSACKVANCTAQVSKWLYSAVSLADNSLTYTQELPAADPAVDPGHMPAITQVSAKGYRVVFFSISYHVYCIVQAQQIMKCMAYLSAKFFFPWRRSFPLFLAELVVEFWIPNHSVPFRFAWWW